MSLKPEGEDTEQDQGEHPILKCIKQADALLHREVARMGAAFLDSYPKDAPEEERKRAHAHVIGLLIDFHPRFQRCLTIPFAAWLASAQKEAAEEGQEKEGLPKGEGCS